MKVMTYQVKILVAICLLLRCVTGSLAQTVTLIGVSYYVSGTANADYSFQNEAFIYVGGTGTNAFTANSGKTTIVSESQIELLPGTEVRDGARFDAFITSPNILEFYELKTTPEETFVVTKGPSLRFLYKNGDRVNETLSYVVYDDQGNAAIARNTLDATTIVAGDNILRILVQNLANNSFYRLELTNEKGDSWYLKFKKM